MSGERVARPFVVDLRDKLRSVQQQAAAATSAAAATATAGWNSLSDSSPSPSSSHLPTLLTPNSVAVGGAGSGSVNLQLDNLNCGSKLLSKWQESWKQIHDANEANFEAARIAEGFIIGINGAVKKQHDVLDRLNSCLVQLPALQNYVHNLTAKIGSMCEDFDILEAGFFELENTNEVLELQRQMEQQRLALQQHQQRRNLDLEKERRLAARNHECLVKEHDLRLRQKVRERQMAFEDQFMKDVAFQASQLSLDRPSACVDVTEDEMVVVKTPPGCNQTGVDVNKPEIIDDAIPGSGAPKGSPSLEMGVPEQPEGSPSLGIGIADEAPSPGTESSLDKGAQYNRESVGEE